MVMNSSLHWLLWKHLLVILHCTTLHYVRRHITRNLSSPPFGVGHLYRLGWCDDLAATETQWLRCTSASRSQWFCRWQIKTSHPYIQTDKTDWLYIRQPTGRLWTTLIPEHLVVAKLPAILPPGVAWWTDQLFALQSWCRATGNRHFLWRLHGLNLYLCGKSYWGVGVWDYTRQQQFG